jgi:hypothetical protein
MLGLHLGYFHLSFREVAKIHECFTRSFQVCPDEAKTRLETMFRGLDAWINESECEDEEFVLETLRQLNFNSASISSSTFVFMMACIAVLVILMGKTFV